MVAMVGSKRKSKRTKGSPKEATDEGTDTAPAAAEGTMEGPEESPTAPTGQPDDPKPSDDDDSDDSSSDSSNSGSSGTGVQSDQDPVNAEDDDEGTTIDEQNSPESDQWRQEERKPDGKTFVFSPTPGQLERGVIDWNSKRGKKIYETASRSLFDEGEKFDCSSDKLKTLLEKLDDRAHTFYWQGRKDTILEIPKDLKKTKKKHINLLKGFARLSYEHLYKYEKNYISRPVRQAQDTAMLYDCLMNSLSTVGIEKIQNYKKEYYLGPFDKDGDTWKSGILLLKIIIRESYIDSRAKVSAIRNQMASLPTYIEEVGYDIIKFNDRVNTLVAELRAHGHTSTDLLVNLLRSYVEVKDDDFRKYIKEKESQYEEGELTLTPKRIMHLAQQKYKILVNKGAWKKPTEDQQKIAVLQAELSKFKKKGKSKPNNDKEKKKKVLTDPEWLANHTPPDASEMKQPKKWKDKDFYWCSKKTGGKCNGKWRRHKPSECKGIAHLKNGGDKKRKDAKEKKDKRQKKKAKLVSAMEVEAQDNNQTHDSGDSSGTEST